VRTASAVPLSRPRRRARFRAADPRLFNGLFNRSFERPPARSCDGVAARGDRLVRRLHSASRTRTAARSARSVAGTSRQEIEMTTRLNGMTMVAAALASMTTLAACDNGEGDPIDSNTLQQPAERFIVDEGSSSGDTTKACSTRSDFVKMQEIGTGNWGSYQACTSFCPADSYAYSATLRSEVGQGSLFDDTALNGIQLDCYRWSDRGYAGSVTSHAGWWGTWGSTANSNPWAIENPFVSAKIKIEGGQGAGDDTSANAVIMVAKNGTSSTPSANTGWGSWTPVRGCPSGTAICGVNTKMESQQGAGDDTALNGISFACCTFAH
jgi:hypothetical protein